jgi:phospholipid/cholesterol/gamma-HCH transport system ATP-binding protein
VIRLEQVAIAFEGTPVLRDVSIEVQEGRTLGIVGPGGAGKSVVMKLLSGLLTPDSGRVVMGGRDLSELTPLEMARMRSQCGMLFQNFALFDFMTVGENVGFPLEQQEVQVPPEEITSRVAARLSQVGLAHAVDQTPRELSGGMKRRVSLARATIAEAPLLLYDDPTAGLDPVSSSKIFALIRDLHAVRTTTAVVVSHDIERMTAVCDHYVLLAEGRVQFSGNLEEARSSKDSVMQAFFQGREGGPV